MTTKTLYQHIVQTPDVVEGKPRIAGRRITVQNIIVWHKHKGFTVDEIAIQYNLTLAEIYATLAYYYDHKPEIDQTMAEDESFVEKATPFPPRPHLTVLKFRELGLIGLWKDRNDIQDSSVYIRQLREETQHRRQINYDFSG